MQDLVSGAGGKMMAGGMTLQEILKASGITLSSMTGDGEDEDEESDTDESMGDEGAKVRGLFSVVATSLLWTPDERAMTGEGQYMTQWRFLC